MNFSTTKKRHQPPAAGANRRHLPPEIAEEILCHLPVKSLNRFRCVSLSWQSLISDHRFIRKHLKTNSNKISTYYKDDPNGLPLFSLTTISKEGGTYLFDQVSANSARIEASCDGLLCITSGGLLYIWNPCMKKYRCIPIPLGITSPLFHSYHFGLGYDSIRDDYILLKVSRKIVEAEIYSLKADSWKKIDNFPQSDIYEAADIVFLNGAIHWLDFRLNPEAPFALSIFDLSKNRYTELPLPEHTLPCDVGLCVLRGMACVFVTGISGLVLWGKKDDFRNKKCSWSTILAIPFEFVFCRFDSWFDVKPLCVYENGEVLVGIVVERRTEVLRCKDGRVMFRKFTPHDPSVIRDGFIHVESLLSLN